MSFHTIDVGNLFSQWHPDIRKFTEDLNKDCVLSMLEKTQESVFDISNFNQVLNLTNTVKCQEILTRISKEKNTSNFIEILKERDTFHPRDIDRGFSIAEIFKLVQDNNYYPILFLELNKKYYIIDGRTRFYCCIFLNVPAKIRMLRDNLLVKTCKK